MLTLLCGMRIFVPALSATCVAAKAIRVPHRIACAVMRLRRPKAPLRVTFDRGLHMARDRPCRYSFSLAFCAQNAAPAPSAARVVKQSLHFLTLFLPLFLRIEGCIGYGNVFRFCRGGGSSFGVPDMHIQLREGYFDAVLCEQFVHSQADIRHG